MEQGVLSFIKILGVSSLLSVLIGRRFGYWQESENWMLNPVPQMNFASLSWSLVSYQVFHAIVQN